MRSTASRTLQRLPGRPRPQGLCPSCRAAKSWLFAVSLLPSQTFRSSSRRGQSSEDDGPPRPSSEPAAMLSRPTWSVRSLLQQDNAPDRESIITGAQLQRLRRLSALPTPKAGEEIGPMIETLASQLLFVRDIQSVNTDGIEPLRSIRDESAEGLKEATIGLDQVKGALLEEEAIGRMMRPRRPRKASTEDIPEAENWDPLRTPSSTAGRYFVVRNEKNS